MVDYAEADPAALHPGAILRQGREYRGLSIDDVSQALKLAPKQVVAIENEEFDLLPGNTFARGFVRNYARFLQIDPAPVVAAVERRLERGEVDLNPPSNAAGTMPVGSGSQGVPRVLLAILMLVVVALAVGVYFERFRTGSTGTWQLGTASAPEKGADSRAAAGDAVPQVVEMPAPGGPVPAANPTAVPPAPAQAVVSVPSPAAEPPAAAVPAAPAAAPGALRRLQFSFGKESWVEVRDGAGKVLAAQLNPTGSTLAIQGQPPFSVVVGNAASVRLKDDGRAVDLQPHISGTVARLKLD